jgi:hypothetical protein
MGPAVKLFLGTLLRFRFAMADMKRKFRGGLCDRHRHSTVIPNTSLFQDMMDGSHEDSYSLLPYYSQQIESTNPNSTAIAECYEETHKFWRLFFFHQHVELHIVVPVIGPNGTHS